MATAIVAHHGCDVLGDGIRAHSLVDVHETQGLGLWELVQGIVEVGDVCLRWDQAMGVARWA